MSTRRVRILRYQMPRGSLRRAGSCDCCEALDDPGRWESADAIVLHVPTLRRFPPGKRDDQIWAAS